MIQFIVSPITAMLLEESLPIEWPTIAFRVRGSPGAAVLFSKSSQQKG